MGPVFDQNFFEDIGMTRYIQKIALIFILGLVSFSLPSISFGANECRIQYGWNSGNTLNGTFKNHSTTLNLNKGQIKTINKSRMNFVKNLKTRQVKFYLKNASNVTLGKNLRNPVAGTYIGNVKLEKAQCLNSSSSSNSGGTGINNPIPGTISVLSQILGLKNLGTKIEDVVLKVRSRLSNSVHKVADKLKQAGTTPTKPVKG